MKKGLSNLIAITTLSVATPLSALAIGGVGYSCDLRGGIYNVLCRIHEILTAVLPVLVALGVVYLVWGVVQYVIGGNEEAKTKGRDTIIFGIIGLVVIVSVWGLVYLITETFDTAYTAPTNNQLKDLIPSR